MGQRVSKHESIGADNRRALTAKRLRIKIDKDRTVEIKNDLEAFGFNQDRK